MTDARDLPDPDTIRDHDLSQLTGLPDDQMVDVLLVLMAYQTGILKPVVART